MPCLIFYCCRHAEITLIRAYAAATPARHEYFDAVRLSALFAAAAADTLPLAMPLLMPDRYTYHASAATAIFFAAADA